MKGETPQEITRILHSVNQGDRRAAEDLFTLVYEELRKMARSRMARETPGHTLQPTALVHEAFLRLMGQPAPNFENRAHFFSAAAEAMRRILIEHARKKSSRKRQGGLRKISLDETMVVQQPDSDEILALDEALRKLEQKDSQMSDVLKLRFFVGFSVSETAEALNIAPRTVDRHWAASRAWLTRELRKSSGV